MHHLFFGINFQIHSVSLTILVLLHLIVDFSTHLCHHPHYRHRSLLHSFLQAENLPFQENPSHRRFMLPTVLPHDNGTGPAVTLIILFLPGIRSLEQRARYFFYFIFLFVFFVWSTISRQPAGRITPKSACGRSLGWDGT